MVSWRPGMRPGSQRETADGLCDLFVTLTRVHQS